MRTLMSPSRRPIRTSLATGFALLLGVAPVWAANKNNQQQPQQPQQSDTVRRIERETGGRVLKVEPIHRGGSQMNRVKVLTPDGRVRVMRDSRSNNGNGNNRSSQQPKNSGSDDR